MRFIDEHFSELDKIIKSVARQFAPKIRGMETEDLYQELWLDTCSKNYSSMPLANTSIHNKAIDILRREYKHYYDRNLIEEDEVNDIFLKEETLDTYLYYVNEYDSATVADLLKVLNNLDDKYKKYVVCKVYLDCNFEELEGEFKRITASLSDNQMKELLGRNESKRTGLGIDKLIAEYVLNFKSENYIYVFKKNLQKELSVALS